jgi:methyltransferase (TIGR00027 family)
MTTVWTEMAKTLRLGALSPDASAVSAPSKGVGQTALFVVCLRQQESLRPDALFHDTFAEAVVEAFAADPVLADVSDVIRRTHDSARGFTEYFAVRTRFFDDAVVAAFNDGVRQVVSLGAGLDGRTVRLTCPEGTRWYEIDTQEMTAVKNGLLARSGLAPTCTRHGVGADLTDDWPTALLRAGFDPSRPTAWLLEGLLMYLTESAGDVLLADLTALSGPGSRLMLEHLQALMLADEGKPARERVESQGVTWSSARDDVASWLADHGWHAEVCAGTEPRIGCGRTVAPLPAGWLATGTLTTSAT